MKKIISSCIVAVALVFAAACENTVIAKVPLQAGQTIAVNSVSQMVQPKRHDRKDKAMPAMGFLEQENSINKAIEEEKQEAPEDTQIEQDAQQEEIEEPDTRETESINSKDIGNLNDDLYWLARVIQAEAGGEWMPDWFQQAVGSVVLNRKASGIYPSSIEGVIFDAGQYYCVQNDSIYHQPSEKAIANAAYILEHGSTLPAQVLGQSEFVQGEIYQTYEDTVLGTTTYFCYM